MCTYAHSLLSPWEGGRRGILGAGIRQIDTFGTEDLGTLVSPLLYLLLVRGHVGVGLRGWGEEVHMYNVHVCTCIAVQLSYYILTPQKYMYMHYTLHNVGETNLHIDD